MTEQQREEQLLSEMLNISESTVDTHDKAAGRAKAEQPILTPREERDLLKAANQIGTPTLVPQTSDFRNEDAPRSFVSDVVAVARKYPILALLAGAGVAYLLARRRR